MKKVIIAWSSKFYQEALNLKIDLEQKGYLVLNYPKNINDEDYQSVYEKFYEDINSADIFILFNLDKKGIEWYIGYESFSEMSFMIVKSIQENNDKKIYIYKMPSKEVWCYDEIVEFLKLWYIELYDEVNF